MAESSRIAKLIAHIVAQVNDAGSYVTKTKLLKLLYLFDVAYYRKHRETFTGFDWIYLKFGPWITTYDDLLERLEANDVIRIQTGGRADFINPAERPEPDEFIESFSDQLILRGVLRNWGEETTNRILDYVYFHTEPMLAGTRFRPLDFSSISEEPLGRYKRSSSGKTQQDIDKLREKLIELRASRVPANPLQSGKPIEYDEVFFRGMQMLEEVD